MMAARVRETVIQAGLTLARDVRLAHADVLLALDRQAIARDNEVLRQRIAALTLKRQKIGDATPVEIAAARTDAHAAICRCRTARGCAACCRAVHPGRAVAVGALRQGSAPDHQWAGLAGVSRSP